MLQNMPQPISVTVCYDDKLGEITEKRQETVVVSKDMPFILLLQTIFSSYPKIQSMYPPGTLGLLVSNKPPTDFSILKEGDVVELFVSFPIDKNKVN